MRRTALLYALSGSCGPTPACAPAASGEPVDGERRETTVTVQTETAVVAPVQRTIRLGGVVQARRRAVLSSPLGGRVLTRPVEVGDRVAAATELARLDSGRLRDSLGAARASLAQIDAEHRHNESVQERTQRLVRLNSMREADLEARSAAVEQSDAARRAAEARVREVQRALGDSRVVAPFAGVVAAVHVEPGEVVGPGGPVATLLDDRDLEVAVAVPESWLASVQVGARFQLDFPLLRRPALEAVVRFIDLFGADAGRPAPLYPVLLSLPADASLAPGTSVELALRSEAEPALRVPQGAVQNPGGQQPRVWVVRDGVLRGIAVEIVAVDRGAVWLRSDELTPEDPVVVSGLARLFEGQSVTLR